ncbi:hypothetical protein [Ottowia sp.]|uniref:hypothetical protein n=1 Tax=Ottowia sp. TaxID=1898956 RepID=UPI0025E73711|nr:hypothetical protein [Ottowia sp.]MBK6616289.1 hypothetical protein [Ottowia sp.]
MSATVVEGGIRFSRYIDSTGLRPLEVTSLDDIPIAEQLAYFRSIGKADGEMTQKEANRLYAVWYAIQVDMEIEESTP